MAQPGNQSCFGRGAKLFTCFPVGENEEVIAQNLCMTLLIESINVKACLKSRGNLGNLEIRFQVILQVPNELP